MAPLYSSVIDSHVHFWHPDRVHVPWVKNTPFDKHKDVTEYTEQIKNSGVKKMVYVETNVDPYHSLVEADWITQYAKETASTSEFGGIGGIVCFAPVGQGDAMRGYLTTLMRITGGKQGGLLKGVRCLLQDPTLDPKRVLQPDFVAGIQWLEAFDLSFDICIDCRGSPQQFPPIQDLVTQCPRVQFILDHMGKPPCDSRPGDADFEFWKDQMIQLSTNKNVSVKISGLVNELSSHNDDEQKVAQQLKPFIQVALEAFGIDRIMYGGDWPVCEIVGTPWQSWLQILCEIVKDWSEDDKERLFVTNATRIYKL